MREIFHKQCIDSYVCGFDDMVSKLKGIDFETVRNQFNSDNPANVKYRTLDEYYYAVGGLDALLNHKNGYGLIKTL